MADQTDDQSTQADQPTRRQSTKKADKNAQQPVVTGDDGATGRVAKADARPPAPHIPPPPGGTQPAPQPPPAAVPAAKITPADHDTARQRPSFWRRLGRGIALVIGWMVAAILGLSAGLLLLAFNVRPFDQLVELAGGSAAVADLEDEIARLQARIAELEDAQDELTTQEAALRAAQDDALEQAGALEDRLGEAEDANTEQQEQLASLEEALAAQDELLAAMGTTLDEYAAQLEALNADLVMLQTELPGQAELAEYNRQLLLMRSWQELLKVRMLLLENNPGLALEVLEAARFTLSQAYALSSAEQQAALDPIIERLSGVANEIVANPFAATGDLEIAWHDLGLLIRPPGELPTVEPTPEGTPTPEATPEESPTPEATP